MKFRLALLGAALGASLLTSPTASATDHPAAAPQRDSGGLVVEDPPSLDAAGRSDAERRTCRVKLAGRSGTYLCGTVKSRRKFDCSHQRTWHRLFIVGENRRIYYMWAIWLREDKKWDLVSDWHRVPGGPRAEKAVWVDYSTRPCMGSFAKQVLYSWRVNTVSKGYVWSISHSMNPRPAFYRWYRGGRVGD